MSVASPASSPKPTLVQLQADVEQARADLLATIDELRLQATPAAMVQRAGRTVTGFFTDEFGGIRPERVAIVGAVVVGVVAIRVLAWRRRR
ncbi:MAG: DUF3618 domain-containing protein [Actinomycetes bacterium]|jgi:hypothetical protein